MLLFIFEANSSNNHRALFSAEGFFESKGGVTAFTFTVNQQYYASPGVTSETDVTSSDELALKVICTRWNKKYDFGDYWSVSATFERVYE